MWQCCRCGERPFLIRRQRVAHKVFYSIGSTPDRGSVGGRRIQGRGRPERSPVGGWIVVSHCGRDRHVSALLSQSKGLGSIERRGVNFFRKGSYDATRNCHTCSPRCWCDIGDRLRRRWCLVRCCNGTASPPLHKQVSKDRYEREDGDHHTVLTPGTPEMYPSSHQVSRDRRNNEQHDQETE